MDENAPHTSHQQVSTLPQLPLLDRSSVMAFEKPVKRINEGHDVSRFLISYAYRDIIIFILQLNRALCPRHQSGTSLPQCFTIAKAGSSSNTPSVEALLALLASIEGLISLAPPDHGERRFGNASFRRWYALLEDRIDNLLNVGCLKEALTLGAGAAKQELKAYLLGAFGSAQRLDYGTGHELSFAAFLGCLWKLGYFQDGKQGGEIERHIVLHVFQSYLDLVRQLIKTYTLEPAGSHGVWGLDDHSFLPFVFGSAQFTRPIGNAEPMPVEGSARGVPSPCDVMEEAVVKDYRATNMYFSAIGFINDVKKGPFWEHSPMLFDISGIRDGWGKINKGTIKMFNAEVLSKFPVVQHFPFGFFFSWKEDPHASSPVQNVHLASRPLLLPRNMQTSFVTHIPLGRSATARVPGGIMASPPAGSRYGKLFLDPSSGSMSPQRFTGSSSQSEFSPTQISLTKAPWTKES